MTENLNMILELFINNTNKIKKTFMWQNVVIKRLVALLYASEGKHVDCDAIHECHGILKKSKDEFSFFCGRSTILMAAQLSLSSDSNKQLANMIDVYDMVKASGFINSNYLAFTVLQIASGSEPLKYTSVLDRIKIIYSNMKKKHWILVDRDDYIFAVMLGLSDVDIIECINRMKQLNTNLKHGSYYNRSGVQVLSQILTLCDKTTEIIPRINALGDAFRDKRIKPYKMYTQSVFGVLALFSKDIFAVVDDVMSAYSFLRKQKGFGVLSMNKKERFLYASSLVVSAYMDESKKLLTSGFSTSIQNLINAKKATILAAVCIAAVASFSSS